MPQTATIESLPAAFRMMKAMQVEGLEWGEDYRGAARRALIELLEGRMDQLIDAHLERMAGLGQADRRNGCSTRWLLTELGAIELAVPRTRTFSALKVVRAYARRAKHVDRMILACFLLGLSTRKVAIALLPVLGRPVSPATVAAFHRRPLKEIYHVLVLDGVVLRRKTGAGALARPVLVALGLRPDGKKEVIDFRLASAESAAQWEQFLGDLVRRGLTGERLEMLCVDGLPGQSGVGAPLPNRPAIGLLAALPTAFPDIPVQRCWAHKIRNVLNKVRKPDQAAVKADLHRIMNARTLPTAWSAARRFADRWEAIYPKAVACLRADLADLLTCFGYPTLEQRKAVRTTNAIERRFREVRRRTRPMGTFQDRTSMDRILFAVFMHENRNQGLATPFALTHNS
jgi:transposase-like protein